MKNNNIYEKTKQELIEEDARYIKQLIDNLISGKQVILNIEEFNLIQKILNDLSLLISYPLNSDNIDQVIGYEKCQKIVAEILSQVLIGKREIFNKQKNYIQ